MNAMLRLFMGAGIQRAGDMERVAVSEAGSLSEVVALHVVCRVSAAIGCAHQVITELIGLDFHGRQETAAICLLI
ncbi:hypothetical protein FEF65_12710 [Mariprofundus erugo]|uniref:Uncharacterized protein n=1 Tax=Mariprofundus erugo TaxID=2528639 RepID=A0A5R9GEQ2_9PROT|nr:hypothetical protein [Mariprofundus erugo]TLS65546.1 hypothetical protein FEF65_12710 [Mariprofundus erugo]